MHPASAPGKFWSNDKCAHFRPSRARPPCYSLLHRFAGLTSLDLHGTHGVTNAQLAAVAQLPRLASINLKGCSQISGADIGAISSLTALTNLNLQSCSRVSPFSQQAASGKGEKLRDHITRNHVTHTRLAHPRHPARVPSSKQVTQQARVWGREGGDLQAPAYIDAVRSPFPRPNLAFPLPAQCHVLIAPPGPPGPPRAAS